MITDKDTNIVYFSAMLKTEKYAHVWAKISAVLNKHNIETAFIEGTKDIWARDYMPIQTDINCFVQFRYEPTYLKNDLNLQSNPRELCELNAIAPKFIDKINLDGGNVVKWHDKVIITDRVFDENPEYTDREILVAAIEKELNTEVIIIPQIKSDFTGHADGLVRFYDDKTIVVNELNESPKYWGIAMSKLMSQYGFDCVEMPMFEYKVPHKNKSISAIGCYINYLEIGNLIIFPIFELEGNKDKEALACIAALYPDKKIEPININDIAFEGGLMNCISWNIKL